MNAITPTGEPTPALSRFSTNLLDVLEQVSYRRIDPADLEDPVYKLRYEAYRREDFLPFNNEGIYSDPLDRSPNAFCFGVFIGDRLVSSLRLHHLTPQTQLSPSMTVYADILAPLLGEGRTFIDPTRFTADRDASLQYPALPFLTLRLALMASEHFAVDYCLSSVRPEHAAFYRRVFLCSEMGPQRAYNGLTFPIVMLATHCPVTIPQIVVRFPFFRSTAEERQQLFGPLGRLGFDEPVAATAAMALGLRERLEQISSN